MMQLASKVSSPALLCGGVLAPKKAEPVEEQMLKFLDGRTHGEELLHALYDHILDEPIPERLRALF